VTVHPVVFLVDVDNTLIDNDHIAADLKRHLEREVGHERQTTWARCNAIGWSIPVIPTC